MHWSFELRGPDNGLIGLFTSRPTALLIAREVLLADETAPRTLLLQSVDMSGHVVGEELLAVRRAPGQVRTNQPSD